MKIVGERPPTTYSLAFVSLRTLLLTSDRLFAVWLITLVAQLCKEWIHNHLRTKGRKPMTDLKSSGNFSKVFRHFISVWSSTFCHAGILIFSSQQEALYLKVSIASVAVGYYFLCVGLYKLSRAKLVHTAVLCYKIAYLFIERQSLN